MEFNYPTVFGGGFSIGVLLAIILSWTTHHNLITALLHGILSWIYVVLHVIGVYC